MGREIRWKRANSNDILVDIFNKSIVRLSCSVIITTLNPSQNNKAFAVFQCCSKSCATENCIEVFSM